MFNILGALSSGGAGYLKGQEWADQEKARQNELQSKQFEMMGAEALGKAFQPDQGPMPPNPGQASMPAQGAPPGPMPGPQGAPPMPPMAMGQGSPAPGPQGAPMPPPQRPMLPGPPSGAGGPPAGPSVPPQPAGGMPQLDLNTLAQRISARNPNLPPQAMISALTQAAPLLNIQGKQQLAEMKQQFQRENMDLRERALDLKERQGQGDSPGQIGMTPEAVEAAAEKFRTTGQLPPGLRDRKGGNVVRDAILNKSAELDAAAGVKPADRLKRQQEFKAEQTAITRFMSGPQGNTVRSLGVVVDHLGTMQELATALKNSDVPAFNRIANAFAAETGSSAPTNAATAAQIVGAEVIKSLGIAGAGTKEERQEAANAFARAKSPEQLLDAINKVVKPLMLGQLKGLRRQFKTSTGLPETKFDQMLGEDGQKFFGSGGGGTQTTAPGATPKENDPLGIR